MTRSRSILALLAAGLFLVTPSGHAAIFFVAPDGTGDYPTIQAAVDAAQPGDAVELGDGVFSGPGNRDIDYHGKTITVRSRSGDPLACIIDAGGSPGTPHRGFHFDSVQPAAERVEGVTVRNGYEPSTSLGGGAVYVSHLSSPTLVNCVLENCSGNPGGGVRCWNCGPVALIGCRILSSPAGGGLDAANCALTITDCRFEGNQGSGLHASNCDLTANRCTFENNRGSGASTSGDEASFEDCVFRLNTVDAGGGGLASSSRSVHALRCRFELNHGDAQALPRCGGAGAMLWQASDAELIGCQFVGNRMEFDTGSSFGGGLYLTESSVVVSACTFRDNQALRGGGIGASSSSLMLDRCTFTGNQSPYGGGGICLDQSSPVVTRSIFAFNMNGNAIWCLGAEAPQLECCDVYGNAGGDWIDCLEGQSGIDGNLCLDPLFCDLAAGNLQLDPQSPCAPGSPWNPECGVMGAFPVGCDEQWVGDDGPRPGELRLSARPDPSGSEVRLAFVVPFELAGRRVTLRIHDVTGRSVRTLLDGVLPEGTHAVTWLGDDDLNRPVGSGVYYGRLELAGRHATRTLRLLR